MGTVLPPLLTDQGDPNERENTRLARLQALREQSQRERVEREGYRVGAQVRLVTADPIPPPGRVADADDAARAALDEQQRQLEALVSQTAEIVEVVQLDGTPHVLRVLFATQNVRADLWVDCVELLPDPPANALYVAEPVSD